MITKKMGREEKIEKYLGRAITKWYADVKKDYNVIGNYVGITIEDDTLTVYHREEGKVYQTEIAYYEDYTAEQIYNIWQETDRWEEVK